jgi:parvulin-like peptidyl-prolyl isomerase
MPKDQPITYSEMRSAYDAAKEQHYVTPGVLRIRLIDLEPAKMRDIDANRPRREQAMEIIDGILNRVKQGEGFVVVANEYLKTNSAVKAGDINAAPDALIPPYDVLAQKAATMKPGEVMGPIEAGEHIFVMQLAEYKPKSVEPFENVQNQVKARISVERMRQAYNKINEELFEQASSADRERFVDFCLHEIFRVANK